MTAELIEAALGIIKPQEALKVECRREILQDVKLMLNLIPHRDQPTAGADRKHLRVLGGALARAVKAVNALSPSSAHQILRTGGKFSGVSMSREEFLTILKGVGKMAEWMADALIVEIPRQYPDRVTVDAARWAFRLLMKYSNTPPSLTPDGAYIGLTQILHEAATGESEVPADRACQHVLEKGVEDVSGYGPARVVRVKSAKRSVKK